MRVPEGSLFWDGCDKDGFCVVPLQVLIRSVDKHSLLMGAAVELIHMQNIIAFTGTLTLLCIPLLYAGKVHSL